MKEDTYIQGMKWSQNRMRKVGIAVMILFSIGLFASSAVFVLAGYLVPGTPVTVASVSSQYNSSAPLDSTHVAVAYMDGTNSNHPTVAICSVSGTTLTCGTPVSLASVASGYTSVAALDSTHVAVAYKDITGGNFLTVAICSVSGTTPTCGTPVAAAGTSIFDISASALDSSHVAVAYRGTTNRPYILVCSVSGITPTCGTPVNIVTSNGSYTSAAALDSSHVAVVYASSIAICSVSGTTPTCGTPVSLGSDIDRASAAALDSSHVVVTYSATSDSYHPYVKICSVSGTTPICDTPVSISSAESYFLKQAAALDSTHVAVSYLDNTNGNNPTVAICSVSGTTPTCETPVSLASDSAANIFAVALDSSHAAVSYTNGSTYPAVVVAVYSPTTFPTVTTQAASSVAATTVTANGNITATGGANTTTRGFAYGTSATLASAATTSSSGSFSTGAFTGSLSGLSANTTYYVRAYGTNTAGTGYGSIQSFTTSAANPTITPISIASSNASTTLAKVGDVVTVTFTSDMASLITPTVSIDGNATTTAINTSGNTWTASTTMATGDTEGTIPFFLNVGNSDGTATTTASAITTGSNIRYDKTAPVVTVTGTNPDTVYASSDSYTDAGATALDSYDGSVSAVSSGSVTLSSAGTYTLTYTATDAAGNAGTATRSVTVQSVGNGGPVGGGGGGGPATVALPNNGGSQPVTSTLSSTASPLPTTIDGLRTLLNSLLAQLAALTGTTPNTPTTHTTFTHNLQLNDSGADVKALQQFLNIRGFVIASSGPGSAGNETTSFGPATYRALIKFQQANGLLATGYFGPLTRAFILKTQ